MIASPGSGTAGGNYNFGTAAATDRALGSLASSSTQRDTEARFTNGLSGSITSLTISYTGEEWRSGTNVNTLTLQYSTNGTTFTSLGSSFNFVSPITAASGGALDGNAAANRVTGIGGTFTLSSAVAVGSTFYLRWVDPDDAGSDAGIAIDDFSLTLGVQASSVTPNYFGVTGQGYNAANSTVFDTTTANFNTKGDGTGTAKVFDPSQVAIFGGTSGAVTVATVTANGGLRFTSAGYVFNGGNLTLGTVPTVEVTNAADTATINTKLSGTAGLSKTGAGTLILGSTTSDFSGGVTIGGGTLSVSADANLGATSNGIALNTGTLQATDSFTTARALTGTGAIAVASGKTLATTGTVSLTGLTISDVGTLDLQSPTPALGALAFTAGGTLSSTTGGTATITGLTAPNLASTATVNAALAYAGTTTLAVNVGTGGDLVLNGAIATTGLTGTGSLNKSGAGTLELNGVNSNLYRVQIGSASATATATGGTVVINNPKSLGNNQLFLNSGTLNASTDLTGANALPIGISVGGLAGNTTGSTPVAYVPAVISGSNVEFAGPTGVFEVANAANSLTINNTTTLSGVVSTSNFTVTGGTIARGNGFIVTSTNNGSLVLSGGAPNTFTDALIVGGSATLNLAKAGALAANVSATVNSGATLLLSGVATVTDRVNNAATVTVNGGGTLHTGGLSEGTRPTGPAATDGGVAGLGALTLSGTAATPATINFGSTTAGSSLVFSGLNAASKGAFVTILNWGGTAGADDGTGTYDRLLFTSDPGFSNADLANFTFDGFAAGGAEIAYGGGFEIVPVPEPATVLGGVLLVGAAAWSQRRRLRPAVLAA